MSRLDRINDGHSCHIHAEIQLQVGTKNNSYSLMKTYVVTPH